MTEQRSESPDESASEQRPHEREDDSATTEDKDEALDRIVLEGRPRLHRSTADLLATGTVAGLEIGMGVLVLLAVENATGSPLLGALAFSIGFIALQLGHSELFTEGFLVPVTVVAAKEGTIGQLLRLWVGTLVGNLVGGWVIAWLIAEGLPELHHAAGDAARAYTEAPLDLQTFVLAVLAGAAITLLTRMQSGTEDAVARIIAAVGIALVIVGTGLHHSILDSIVVFVGLHAGQEGVSYGTWLPWFGLAVAGNMVGGLVLTTMLRLIRSKERLGQWRDTAGPADEPDGA